MITFDPSISLGAVIQTVIVLGGGLMALGAMRANVSALAVKMERSGTEAKETIKAIQAESRHSFEGVQEEIKKIGSILINQADQNRRIIHLEDDVRELRHGEGFVRGVTGIDRVFP